MASYDPHKAYCVNDTCRQEIPDPDRYAWQEVIGWERKRGQGGTNHLAIRRPTGRFMCPVCMMRLQDGTSPGQLTL